jgi:hypothetical protein
MKSPLFGKPLRLPGACAVLVLSQLFSAPLPGQDTAVQEKPAAQQDVPDFSKVIDDYIEATGGEKAYREIESIRVRARMSMPAFGLEGETELIQKGGKGIMKMNLTGIGEIKMGFDGETAWQTSEMTGPEIMEGEQRDQLVMQMDLAPMLNLAKKFDTVKCTGVEEFNGEPCHVVVCEKEGNYPVTHYFSVKSKLQMGTRLTAVSNQGEFESVSRLSDYRDVNGVKMPFKTEADLPNSMVMVTELQSVEANSDVGDDAFELPDDVKALKK